MKTAVAEDTLYFDRLYRRIRLSGTLRTVTGLHIGGRTDEVGASDLPVLRDARDLPMIPGSSIKGVLRTTVESLVRAFSSNRQNGDIWSCNPLAQESVSKRGREGACGAHKANERPTDADGSCAVCRLFGSHILASHTRISDAFVRTEPETPLVEIRDGVAIDRDCKVVSGSQKYDFEVVSPGVEFALEVFVDNLQDWSMGLLFAGFDQMAEGFTALGGGTSRGLGRVDIQWHGILETTVKTVFHGQAPAERTIQDWRKQFMEALHEKAQAESRKEKN